MLLIAPIYKVFLKTFAQRSLIIKERTCTYQFKEKVKQLYQKTITIKSAILYPRVMGIIHEYGGKIYLDEHQWAEAATYFFEVGNQRHIQCLKYFVLANMLMKTEMNPFDGQEAKPYKNVPEILTITNLMATYQRNEILEFGKILKSNRRTIMDDPFIRNYIENLLIVHN
ncbi:unnamed protein product [Vicia faba]|uniref:Uncharacterized protein n=1 Tax=Vicia faba TaxID=3906 RepID=A0AAV0Z769_VICFA|nr:unnamed protein product [Vicia faba]